MARKAKGSGFKMRSTNKTSFKDMGSSPVKYTNPATDEPLNPYFTQSLGGPGVDDDDNIFIKHYLKTKEDVEAGTKIDPDIEIEKNVPKVEKVEAVKPNKTKFQEKWEKKHGTGDYARGGSKERERIQTGESEWQYKNRIKKMNRGLEDLRGTTDDDSVDLTVKTGGAPVETGSGGATYAKVDKPTKFSPSGTEARKKEYDAKGWKYDDTIKGYNRDGTEKKKKGKFRVQLMVGDDDLGGEVLKKMVGLGDIDKTKQGTELYIYHSPDFETQEEADAYLAKAKQSGFENAFIPKKSPAEKRSGFKMKSSPAKIYSKPKGKRTEY
jgi:hypothetical protein